MIGCVTSPSLLAALLGTVALIAIVVLIVWRWRVGTLMRRTERLEQRVRQRTHALQLATEELHFLALHDELTALTNQRGFWQQADKLEMDARTRDTMFGLVLIDIDHFKWINDRHGHRTGDEVLRHAAGLMERLCGEQHEVCRYGGEEFAILVAETDPEQLRELAEMLRTELAARPYEAPTGEIAYTVSVGLTYWLAGHDNVEGLFRRADRALYEAKETRDTCMMWNPAMDYDPEAQKA